jgi:TolB protein
MRETLRPFWIFICLLLGSPSAWSQWVNHYPKLQDFGHHTYLEQHELPILAHGITDPAAAPDGKRLAFSSRGWIWILDLQSAVATRLTDTAGSDSRPRWSPDGQYLAFVRDSGADTSIVLKDLRSGEEQVIDSAAIDLDPEFSRDGDYLYYSSGSSGSLDLYQRHIASGVEQAITRLRQVERNVRRIPGSDAILYLHGAGAHRVLRQRDPTAGSDEIVHAETLTYHLTADVHPAGRVLVFSAPIDNDYHLWTMDLQDPRVKHRLTDGESFALTPSFSADGERIYFVTLDENRQFKLMQMPTYGGDATAVRISKWDYGTSMGQLNLSIVDDANQPLAARLTIVAGNGHPVPSPTGATYIDSQTGRPYFYADGVASFTLPAGPYRVIAARGPMNVLSQQTVVVIGRQDTAAELKLTPLWDGAAAGYVSADYHGHLNGDGHQRATHDDALKLMAGEDLNKLAPMSWNRWERRIDEPILGKRTVAGEFEVIQGQEVRSHFHGHIGLLNVSRPFVPWFFGPYNPILGDPNLSNGDVFAHARATGAFATYVHPMDEVDDPFSDEAIHTIPLELVSDGVLEDRMGLEIVCAWTSPLANAKLWYRLLNIGQPIAAMSGTDAWVDFHRTPAMGTGRAYIRPFDGMGGDEDPVLAAAIAGRSFVTTGPALVFALADGSQPGDVTDSGMHDWTLTVASTVALEMVELVVNGRVVATLGDVTAGATRTFKGTVNLPSGGWIAARAYAAQQRPDSWPTMHARPFAHSSPIWIGEVGSSETTAKAAAAADLIRAIDAAERRARDAYGDQPMPRLYDRFESARNTLRPMLNAGP